MAKPTIHLICNAHLDPVWQWRWEEGCAEALSTFAAAVDLLREHPRLIFNHNEALLYQWVREHAPNLFQDIQTLAAAGRWVVSGGWYLQPDVNLPETESLIRHMASGRRFFREHFGAEPVVAYNFDSFGHSGGLPQLLQLGGYKMYIHMRPQEPDLPLPSDFYRWRGVDGSEVLGLRIAVGLYHTERDNIEQRLQEGVALALRLKRDVPVFWGLGNHGGGPTRADLERIDAFIGRTTKVDIVHSTPDRLYAALKQMAHEAPVVEGDLQRVFTGCYTSLSRLKRLAVQSAAGLVQAEALRVATWWQSGQAYPRAELDAAWQQHLFNDFHDILPGTCTEPAETDALDFYGQVHHTTRQLRWAAAAAFNRGAPRSCYVPVTILNANPALERAPVEVECMLDLRPKWTGSWHLRLFDLDGKQWPCQEEQPDSLLPFNGWRRKVCFFAELPALGVRHYQLEIAEGPRELPACSAALRHETNPQTGLPISLDAGKGRECLAGEMPKPLMVEDSGDAWGTGQWSYRQVLGSFECDPDSVAVIENGPIRSITQSVHRFGSSQVIVNLFAYARWPVLEFRLRILWFEERHRLKLSIPTVFQNPHILCEVPAGATVRPADGQEHVHRRWLLLESNLHGRPTALAVLHDGCHGFDFRDGEIRLSVLRSAAYCHEQGFNLDSNPAVRKYMDQGMHQVRLLVTAGDADTVRNAVPGLADWLSAPPLAYAHLPLSLGPATPSRSTDPPLRTAGSSFLSLGPSNVRLLACKQSWDGRAVVLRIQEMAGRSTTASLQCAGMTAPTLLPLNPYEIKTLRVDPDGSCQPADLIWETPAPA